VSGLIDLSEADAHLYDDGAMTAGAALGSVPDQDGDGRDELLIGASRSDESGPDAGAVFLLWSGTLW